ncbi:unnamed protein product [Candida verbasci]|uniref:FAD-binding FR-type domain-containing protein n=1 Tax=Candida verbasci TaxID=1227364 RepID=A0A9W4XBU6_9ASCO|nr:unnamed protein product [Candida verbasci]
MKFISFLAFILLTSLVTAHGEGNGVPYTKYEHSKPIYCCNYEIRQAVTYCPPGNYTCLCSNKNALATYAGCLSYKKRNGTHTLHFMEHWCEENGNVTLAEDWYKNSYKHFLDNAKSASEIPSFNKSKPIDVPFKLNTSEMDLFKRAYDVFLDNYDDSLYYSSAILGYWLLIFIIGAFMNWSKFLFPGFYKKATNPVVNYWRKYITMPATFHKKKSQEQKFLKIFDFLIPSRFESIVLFIFYVMVIVVHCMNVEFVEKDPLFYTAYRAQWRYIADRSGIVGTFITPFVYLLAGRNNFLQWLTGWNYNVFITFHKHTARVMFCLIAIHAVGFTILLIGRYAAEMKETYMIWGTLATVAGGIMLVQAMLFFRRRWYELFLLIHILMAVFWLAGTWIHVDKLGYIQMVYPAVAVWVFDRIVRVGRLISFGFPTATVTLESNETIKIVVPKPSYWKSIPGGHAFIHFLKPTYFWQSHPFTFTEESDNSNIVFFAKVKGGVTHSLYQTLAKAPGRSIKIKVGVEGPYGEATPAKYADTPVFVAGGNGIPGIYSEAIDIAKHLPKDSNKVVKLTWIIREYSNLIWFYKELQALKNLNVQTTVYVTKPEILTDLEQFNTKWSSGEESESVEKGDSLKEEVKEDVTSTDIGPIIQNLKSELSHITILEGRPNLETYVAKEIEESNGSLGFVACGHPAMVDELRFQVSEMVTKSKGKRLDFYEQLQIWA